MSRLFFSAACKGQPPSRKHVSSKAGVTATEVRVVAAAVQHSKEPTDV